MAAPVEIFDDLSFSLNQAPLPIPLSPPGIVHVVQTTKAFVPGSVRVFLNGVLQSLDNVVEVDPTNGFVGIIEEDNLVTGDVIHVVYLTTEPVFVNPTAPVHISQVRPGDVLRIAMRAGRHLEPVAPRRGAQPQLHAREKRGRVARNSSRTVFVGYVTANQPETGVMNLQVPHRQPTGREHYAATVKYRDILYVHKWYTSVGRKPIKVLF